MVLNNDSVITVQLLAHLFIFDTTQTVAITTKKKMLEMNEWMD